ncbi:hypothetical protein [Aquiflexum gelatinilyticum]|uniref:Uncharacterized protein n=1 Tax=Aquiflexum gelatinilyticum TaxID=2961943 RepID=A0A9X2SY40_9BACT|nr:hypothetical protein [Aquiflexum gelatinilyticum]MCR9014584.1 hypothetical protein [Aquiflexum gelatinilyticum]
MKTSPTIPKNPTLAHSMDYERLRQEGLAHIEQLSSNLWTDYNSHDPGITMLEALCYAITELGYRSNFEIKDLLTQASGQTFFTARQILTSAPLTITDYRKLLVDIQGINNAWLFTDGKQEVPIYLNCEEDKLQYEKTNKELVLKGLYTVLLDLSIDQELGDLNTGDIELENIAFPLSPMTDIEAGEFQVKFELPSIKEVNKKVLTENPSNFSIEKNPSKNWVYNFKIELPDGEIIEIPFRVSIPKNPSKGKILDSHVAFMLQDPAYGQLIFDTYLEKISKAEGILKNAIKVLQENRNLCEDFIRVEPIDSEEVAFCFDVDVSADTDIERVQAEIYFTIEHYLNPPVSFYTLKELMEKGIPTEEIFEGPRLAHGFIDTEEIENAQLRSVIYASDIINLLMDIKGVNGIRNFLMTKYDKDGKPVPGKKGISWCMPIVPLHKPVLSTSFSKILFFKDGFPFLSQYEEVRDTVQLLHAQRSIGKLVPTFADLPVPKGRQRDTMSYWPVQYDLPMVYGVGEFGLPPHADDLRIAQQQQLKGYLMFYEQLLADFNAQLTNAKSLFSTDEIRQTYFAQYLGSIREIDGILHTNLEKAIANDPLDPESQALWQRLYENQNLFFERRNKFLDHLLARFAESFNDYALLMYRINLDNISLEKIGPQETVDLKIRTLQAYPEISYSRSLAFNYFPQDENFELDETRLWDTDNVSGLEKRISYLTGIGDFTRRFLYCIKNVEIICEEKEVGETIHCMHSFSLTSRNGIKMLSKQFEDKATAEAVLVEVMELGTNPENYHYTTKKIKLKKQNIIILESEKTFATEEDALTIIQEIIEELTQDCNEPEGLHLIEHLLLRPKSKNFKLMEVCLHDCECPCEEDIYSFRASVVLPHWPKHFDDMAFRQYFEKKIREEAPAHIQLKVCWVSNEKLREFETSFKAWIKELASYKATGNNHATYQEANDRMLAILAKLNSVYPKATLHDCEESDADKNPVMLGKTILGTQKL